MAMCKSSSAVHYHSVTGNSTHLIGGETCWTPNTDVYATEGRLVIKVELSGMRREDLELSFDGNLLTIKGHRPDSCRTPQAKCRFLKMEISYGAFQSVIEIPNGFDLLKAQAAYQNGFLRIDVPEMQGKNKQLTVPVKSPEE